MTVAISIQEQDFDLSAELAILRKQSQQVGAVASFVGAVRGDSITQLQLEHYPGMTEKSIQTIVDDAMARWPLEAVRVIHRVGCLSVGEQIVLVAVASSHRGEAFSACEFIMDFLKTQAPFWKKEIGEGGEHWVDARETDNQAAERWSAKQ
jgi:molybdopterin synthase catalytic subunit